MGALALITLTALLCFTGSLIADRKGQLLLLLAGIAAILAVVIFGAGLLNSDYANPRLEPAAAMNLFEANTFGITADEAMESSYDFVWWLGYGFWLALATAVIAFVATVVPSIKKKPQTHNNVSIAKVSYSIRKNSKTVPLPFSLLGEKESVEKHDRHVLRPF